MRWVRAISMISRDIFSGCEKHGFVLTLQNFCTYHFCPEFHKLKSETAALPDILILKTATVICYLQSYIFGAVFKLNCDIICCTVFYSIMYSFIRNMIKFCCFNYINIILFVFFFKGTCNFIDFTDRCSKIF